MVLSKEQLMVFVYQYFEQQGLSEEESKRRAVGRDEWFGIVDEHNPHDAILHLIKNEKTWEHFFWYVAVINDCL